MGIEKITDKIMEDAKDYESVTLSDAKKTAEDIANEYRSRAEREGRAALERGKKAAESIISRAESGAALVKRNNILQMKAGLVDDSFNIAEERIISLPEDKLLSVFMSILSTAAEQGRGEIIFNLRDRKKFGEKFVNAANKKMKEEKKNSDFILSGDTANIKNGFILKYGNIETNCSIEKIIEARRTQLEPRVIDILFRKK